MQPLGEASGESTLENLGETAYDYLHEMPPNLRDTTFGIRKERSLYYIGNKQVTIDDNNIMVDEKFVGTPGIWELLMSKKPNDNYYTYKDYDNYKRLIFEKTSMTVRRYFTPRLNLENACISTKSAAHILSIPLTKTLRFLNFHLIGLCNSSATLFF